MYIAVLPTYRPRSFLLHLLETSAHASTVLFISTLDNVGCQGCIYANLFNINFEIFAVGCTYAHVHILADLVTSSIS